MVEEKSECGERERGRRERGKEGGGRGRRRGLSLAYQLTGTPFFSKISFAVDQLNRTMGSNPKTGSSVSFKNLIVNASTRARKKEETPEEFRSLTLETHALSTYFPLEMSIETCSHTRTELRASSLSVSTLHVQREEDTRKAPSIERGPCLPTWDIHVRVHVETCRWVQT